MTGPAGSPVSPRAAAGDATSKLGGRSVIVRFGVVLAVILVLAAIVAILADAPAAPPDCQPGTECGGPPPAAQASAPPAPVATGAVPATPAPVPPGTIGIRAGSPWKSADLGFEFEYSDWWTVDSSDGSRADLIYQGSGDALLIVAGVKASDASPEGYADRWFELIQAEAPDLRVDSSEPNAILGPGIGFVGGVGRTYAGTWTSPQAATVPIGVGVVTASDGRTTVAVVLVVWNPDVTVGSSWRQYAVRSTAELVLKTFRWGLPS